MFFDLNDEFIRIDRRDNICSVCGKPFIHSRRFIHGFKDGDKTIKEMTLVSAHAGCRDLVNRLNAKKQEVLDLEYKIFSKQNTEGTNQC